jgi:signal peptidase II
VKPELRPYFVLALIIALADQISKILIRQYLLPGDSVQVLGDFLRFTFVYNQGGAFGIKLGNIIFYSAMSFAAAVIIIVYMIKTKNTNKIVMAILALVVGGAIGNFLDRIVYGQVVDFIDVNMPDIRIPAFSLSIFNFSGFELYRWYIFNIADSALTVGLVGFIAYLLIKGDILESRPEIPADNLPPASPPISG